MIFKRSGSPQMCGSKVAPLTHSRARIAGRSSGLNNFKKSPLRMEHKCGGKNLPMPQRHTHNCRASKSQDGWKFSLRNCHSFTLTSTSTARGIVTLALLVLSQPRAQRSNPRHAFPHVAIDDDIVHS
ncbi:hypothetical protein TRVL_10348 [Trypanosoma vivax]|nr:hypothetical protein TRVL_10348 [Trypanosoma vivax]